MEILLVTWSIPVVKFQCVACAGAHAHWLSCSGVFATPWTVARQAPLSMEFSRQGYWRGLLFPSPEDLPHPRIEPASPVAPGGFSTTEPPEWVSEWSHSVVSDSATPWTVTYQAPPSMGFSRQGYWSGLPFPSPGDLPDPGIEPTSLASPALAGRLFILHHLGSPSLI